MRVTVFKNIHEINEPYFVDVLLILKRIKEGNSADLIKTIRRQKDKEKQNDLKKRLPSICFSGRFRQREDNEIMEHSGLICLDIDDIATADLKKVKAEIRNDEFTFASFVSPRGNGLKILIQIPPVIKEHSNYFNALKQHYDGLIGGYESSKENKRKQGEAFVKIDESQDDYLRVHIDPSGKNLSRVCYESADADVYWNQDSGIWEEIVETVTVTLTVEDADRTIELLQIWIDKQEQYFEGNRNKYLSKFTYALCRYGIEETTALSYLNKKFEDYPFKDLQREIKSVYKKGDFGTTSFTKEERRQSKAVTPKIQDSTLITQFWDINDKGRVKIETKRFIRFIEAFGFGIYRHKNTPKSWDYIRVVNMIVKVVAVKDIKDVVLDYLEETKAPEIVFDELMMKNRYFEQTFLNALKGIDVQQIRDIRDKSYIFFKDYYYQITASGSKRMDYLDLDGRHIWEKQICKKNITEVVDYTDHDFTQFLYRAMGSDQVKYKSAMAALGYVIHTYKRKSLTKLIYACDANVGELDDMPMGGTGKNLMTDILGYVRAITHMDGNDFKADDTFKFQNVTDDTQIIVFDEYKGTIKELFAKITGHFGVERKSKDRTIIDFEFSPKIITTSNHTPKGFSDSYARRFHIIEFSDHYSDRHTPSDEFKKGDFFSEDWAQDDYNCIYSFVFDCVQMYLKEGLKKLDQSDMAIKVFKLNTGVEFAEYWMHGVKHKVTDWFNGREVMEHFIQNTGLNEKDISQKDFYGNIKKMCKIFGFKYDDKGSGVNRMCIIQGFNFKTDKKKDDDAVPF